MALYRYFKLHSDSISMLLDPQGQLLKEIPSTSVVSAKRSMVQQPAKTGPYTKVTSEQRAAIGKRALEPHVAATVLYCEKRFPNVKESSVRTWRNAYMSEIKKRWREGHEDVSVEKLTEKKRGRPFLLREELKMQVRAF